MQMWKSTTFLFAVRWGLLAGIFLLWEVGARLGKIDLYYYSMPSRILGLVTRWYVEGILIKNLMVTMGEAAVGFGIGLSTGMVTGFVLASNKYLNSILQPFITILNAMPRIAFAPLIILWFGLGFASKVVMVVSLVYFVVFFNTYRGFKEVSPVLLKNASVLGASRSQILWHIYLPATMSWIFASIRVCVGFAIIGAILGEYIGSSAGIGYLIDNAQSQYDATGVMAGLSVITFVIAALDPVLHKIEARVSKWTLNNERAGGIV